MLSNAAHFPKNLISPIWPTASPRPYNQGSPRILTPQGLFCTSSIWLVIYHRVGMEQSVLTFKRTMQIKNVPLKGMVLQRPLYYYMHYFTFKPGVWDFQQAFPEGVPRLLIKLPAVSLRNLQYIGALKTVLWWLSFSHFSLTCHHGVLCWAEGWNINNHRGNFDTCSGLQEVEEWWDLWCQKQSSSVWVHKDRNSGLQG